MVTTRAARALLLGTVMEKTTHYRRHTIDGLDVFYREAGAPSAPTLVLLHGFPTSSHMFRDLIPRLAARFHVIAPDYPGFGYSAAPDPREFAYTFDHVADVIDKLLVAKQLTSYGLYLQDFGGPIGFRIATRHPDRVRALVIQNANAYDDGLAPGTREVVVHQRGLEALFERPATVRQYLTGEPDPTAVSPDAIEHAQWGMDRPGNKAIQLAMHRDYVSNIALYPTWQAYLRAHQPPTLIVWGLHDPVFEAAGAEAYRRDLPSCELHLLDAGHFALESQCEPIAERIHTFFDRLAPPRGT
jgi:pimeloyl-ACP methyl ester carboxylesterase